MSVAVARLAATRLLGLGLLTILVAVIADRLLRWRARGEPGPIDSLAVIEAPIEAVWPLLIDIPGQPRWMHDMKSVRMTTGPPLRIGSRGEATVRMYGLSVTDPVEVTVLEPPTRFGLRHEGRFSGGGTFELEAGANERTTIVRWSEVLRPPILPNLADIVTRPVFRRVFQADLLRFRDLVEAAG
ncbi:MAG: SRPBCC family protein [Chloroflexi bacterium]|nr:SRPBCC family protein [Chloroflexota bacterium]